jgi:hypothetical protein
MPNKTISALLKARAAIQPIKKDGSNPHFRSSYATLEGVIEAVTQPLSNHGFFLTHVTGADEFGMFVTTELVSEDDGVTVMRTRVPLVLGKNDMQGLGSAITYARRYGIMSLLNLPTEDDDGNLASRSSGPPKGQAQSSGGDW